MSKTTWAARTAKFAVLTTVFAAGGTGVAVAGSTTGSGGIFSGNQVNAPLSIPATVCGNAIAVLGDAFGGCESAASASSASQSSASHSSTSHHSTSHHAASHSSTSASSASASSQTTSGSHSVLGGNQVSVPVSVPVTVCGNAAAVLGRAMSGCETAASASGAPASSQTTSGSHSVAGGNQVSVPVSAPVTVCGNALSVAGRAESSCAPGGSSGGASASGASSSSQTTSGSHSVAGGNQVSAPVSVPVTVCGNAAAVLGRAMGGCEPAASASGAAAGSQTTSGSHSIAGGNQDDAP